MPLVHATNWKNIVFVVILEKNKKKKCENRQNPGYNNSKSRVYKLLYYGT